jgi:hypothetical protein
MALDAQPKKTRMRMKPKNTMSGLALSLVALALAGCGSNSPARKDTNTAVAADAPSMIAPKATASTTLDPCNVLTADAVATVTSDKVTHTEVIDHDCHYHTGLDDDGTVISIYPSGGKEQMEDVRKAYKLLGGIGGAVSGVADVGKDVQSAITAPAEGRAPALGDEALWGPNDVLAVLKGDVFVQVTPPVAHDPASHHGMLVSGTDKRAMAQKLASAALAKLAP